MTYTMKGEDDLLSARPPMFSSGNSVAGQSYQSTMSTTTMLDARLLAQANSQATIAARSILVSGGTEDTALKTACAAAHSVLLASYERQLNKRGPKAMSQAMFLKRKIKKQAEVVSSMALAAASTSIQNNNFDSAASVMDAPAMRAMQVQYDSTKDASTIISSLASPRATPVTKNQDKRQFSAKVPLAKLLTKTSKPPSRGVIATAATAAALPTSSTDGRAGDQSVISPTETSEQEIMRPVAIRIETKTNKSPLKYRFQRKAKKETIGPVAAAQELEIKAPVEEPIIEAQDNTLVQTSVSSDTETSSDDTEEKFEEIVEVGNSRGTEAVSRVSESLESTSIAPSRHAPAARKGMFEPCLSGFANTFGCFGVSQDYDVKEAETNLNEDYEPRSPVSHVDASKSLDEVSQVISASEDDSRGSFFEDDIFDNGATSTVSSAGTYSQGAHESSSRSLTTREALKQKMEEIVGRDSLNKLSQSHSEYTSDEDRSEYSSDSRDDIDYGESWESSQASSQASTVESQRYGRKEGYRGRTKGGERRTTGRVRR